MTVKTRTSNRLGVPTKEAKQRMADELMKDKAGAMSDKFNTFKKKRPPVEDSITSRPKKVNR